MIAQGHIRTAHNADAVARCEWAFGPIGVVPSPPSATFRLPGGQNGGRARATGNLANANGKVNGHARKAGAGTAAHSDPDPDPNESIPGSEGGYQKVCLLDMCGVHLGPLYSISTSSVIQPYLQWFENAAARELFEFQDSASVVSQEYTKALGMVLENGVKVVLLASLNDQVVRVACSSVESPVWSSCSLEKRVSHRRRTSWERTVAKLVISPAKIAAAQVDCPVQYFYSADPTGTNLWRLFLHRLAPTLAPRPFRRRRELFPRRLHDQAAQLCIHAAERGSG